MNLILVLIILFVVFGGYGWHSGYLNGYAGGGISIAGVILLLVILRVFGLI